MEVICLAEYEIINGRGWFYAKPDSQRYDIGNYGIVLLTSQIVPVAGSGTDVRFDNGAYLVSKGKINCYPDKGQWSTNETNSFI